MEYNTPKNIMEYTQSQILDLINDNDSRVFTNKSNRLKLINIIYNLLGYKLDMDILLAMLAEPESMLILATAGGGKTTMSQIKIILEKIVRRDNAGKPLKGKRMLCLVYNTQNVPQMERKQNELITKLYAKGITGVDLDRNIVCRTMHAFCLEWRNEYITQMGLLNYTQLSDDKQNKMFQTIAKTFAKKYDIKEENFSTSVLTGIYNLTHELMVPYEDMESLTKFEEVNLDIDIVVEFFNAYDNMKKIKRVYDYTDMLSKTLELLQTNDEARKRVQEHYDYIIVDEFQDCTPIMTEIVKCIKGDNTPLLCIGDEDQCIYNFRGADINNILEFKNKFPNGEIYSLGANRRCRKEIFEAAKSVIERNELRFDKPMFCIKDGGKVELRSYYSQMGQLINIVDDLKNLPSDELNDTIICYREQKSSIRLTSILDEHNIPFHILSGYGPYSHELFKHLTDVFDMIYMAKDREYLVNLYKVTEMTRSDCYMAIHYDAKKKKFKDENDYKHFLDRNYGKYSNRLGFLKTMNQLNELSQRILTEPMCNYFDEIWELFKKYFWNWKKSQNENEEIDTYFEEQVAKIFKSKLTYEHFLHEYELRTNRVKSNNLDKAGVAISTFHKLKGLEYKNVYIIDLSDDIFPNYSRIELQKYKPETEKQLKESEVRLMFVAMTRAKDNLYLYYNANNPSLYAQWVLDWKESKDKQVTPIKSLESFSLESLMQQNTSSLQVEHNSMENNNVMNEPKDYEDDIEDIELELDDYETDSPSNLETADIENPSINNTKENVEVSSEFKNINKDVLNNSNDFMNEISNAESDIDTEDKLEQKVVGSNNANPSIGSNFFLSSILDRI